MTLRTQVDPYVLVGDLADLPSPADIAQGTLFHAEDTGDCRVLVINPLSNVRYWDVFCGTSASSGTVSGTFFLKFSGTVPPASGGSPAIYLTDDSPNNASTVEPGYYLPSAASVGQPYIFIVSNGTSVTSQVKVYKNNVPVISVTVGIGFTGKINGVGAAVSYAAGDILDVAVGNPTGSGGNIVLSVMLAVTPS